MNSNTSTSSNRQAAQLGLAIVGFVALVALGMWLAIYSARFVPTAINRIGAAAVYLGSVFNPEDSGGLSVVPTATTTIPFGDGLATSTPATSTPVATTPVVPTPGQETTSTTQIGGTTAVSLYGLPDLAATITTVGYLATSSPDSFVAATSVPTGARAAVRFTIKNVGTNASGLWRFSAMIPTPSSYLYQSAQQQSLKPGESIDYTLGFDQATRGNQTISIKANFDNTVAESSQTNNNANAQIVVN